MRLFPRLRGLFALAVLATGLAVVTTDFAEAQRRGGSMGSRGSRTYSAPAPTQTAPNAASPVQRSMTPQNQAANPAAAARNPAAQQQRRGGMFGGLAGGLLGGLMLGGLIGMLMGNGLGGLAGIFGLILQLGLAALVVMLVMRLFRGRGGARNTGLATAGGPSNLGSHDMRRDEPVDMNRSAYTPAGAAAGAAGSAATPAQGAQAGHGAHGGQGGDEIGLDGSDFDAFEQLLAEVKAAYTREDYAQLRARCTPEIVSFLSEELSENAVNGRKNDHTDVRLVQGDLAEAWREGNDEYATVAMRYESVDVVRDRQSGAVVSGSTEPTETTELWTFARPAGGAWKLSAIQPA